jgi:hypothetical protein
MSYFHKDIISNDVINTAFNQMWRIVSGPVSLLLIPLFITPEIQGFWYTFGSISALSIFADLGFTTIVCQFAAHEFAFLSFNGEGNVDGNNEYIDRLSSLFRFVIRWTLLVVVVIFPIIFIVGFLLFMQKADIAIWIVPWTLYLVGSALAFINGVLASFLQGCDQVANVQKIGLKIAITNTLAMFFCLILHFGLYAIAISVLISNIIYSIFLIKKYQTFLIALFKKNEKNTSWKKSIFGLLWKYALSWSSGYFIFQIYTPFMFQFHGAIEAGKVGITISLVTAIFSISNTWFTANTPYMNILVAKREWKLLDKEYNKNLVLTIGTYVLGIGFLLIIVYCLRGHWLLFDKLTERFLGLIPIIMLCCGWFFQIIINGIAVYLRAHKKEPLVVVSMANGVFIVITTYLCAHFLSTQWFFSGFVVSYIFILPWVLKIQKNSKKVWHCE